MSEPKVEIIEFINTSGLVDTPILGHYIDTCDLFS